MSRIMALIERAAPWAAQNGKFTRTRKFALLAILLTGGAAAVFGFVLRLEVFDAAGPVVAAVFLGVAATILLGVGLMAAVFHSSRSGLDEEAAGRGELDRDDGS